MNIIRKSALAIFVVAILNLAMFAQAHQGSLTAKVSLVGQVHQVSLTWSAGNGGGIVNGFIVQRGTVTGGPYTTICGGTGQPSCPTSSQLSYVDVSGIGNVLVEGTTYFYIVVATGPGGQSPPSNEVPALIPFLRPSAPSNLQAIPQ